MHCSAPSAQHRLSMPSSHPHLAQALGVVDKEDVDKEAHKGQVSIPATQAVNQGPSKLRQLVGRGGLYCPSATLCRHVPWPASALPSPQGTGPVKHATSPQQRTLKLPATHRVVKPRMSNTPSTVRRAAPSASSSASARSSRCTHSRSLSTSGAWPAATAEPA